MHAVAEDLHEARERTLALVAGLDDDALHRPLAPIMSPLVWDLGHIAAYEDLWAVHRLGGEPLLRPDLAALFDAFETPRAVRADAELLDRRAALEYLDAVRERTLAVLDRTGRAEQHELVRRHELQHTETMRQALFLGGLPGGTPESLPELPAQPEWVDVPGGAVAIGAADEGFAYDNERPRHEVTLAPFRIARTPVTVAAWEEHLSAAGGDAPLGWDAQRETPAAPVQHVSWHEARGYATAHGGRLPTEAEWEAAASAGLIDAVGFVWEWTETEFCGYPGFRAHPYPEYSEVFFGRGMRVLRGGSWATAPGVAGPTFRNWDLPERRQIYSGLRLVEEG